MPSSLLCSPTACPPGSSHWAERCCTSPEERKQRKQQQASEHKPVVPLPAGKQNLGGRGLSPCLYTLSSSQGRGQTLTLWDKAQVRQRRLERKPMSSWKPDMQGAPERARGHSGTILSRDTIVFYRTVKGH